MRNDRGTVSSVTVLNITYASNRSILQKCPLLHDYSFFVNEVETRYKREHMPLDAAIRQSMDYCFKDGILSEFIHNHYEEAVMLPDSDGLSPTKFPHGFARSCIHDSI